MALYYKEEVLNVDHSLIQIHSQSYLLNFLFVINQNQRVTNFNYDKIKLHSLLIRPSIIFSHYII